MHPTHSHTVVMLLGALDSALHCDRLSGLRHAGVQGLTAKSIHRPAGTPSPRLRNAEWGDGEKHFPHSVPTMSVQDRSYWRMARFE